MFGVALFLASFNRDNLFKNHNLGGCFVDSLFLIGKQKIGGEDYPASA